MSSESMNGFDHRVVSSKDSPLLPHICQKYSTRKEIRFRGGWSDMKLMYDIVTQHEECKRIIDKCGWEGLLEINVPLCNKKLADAIVERWWESTNTFHFSEF